MTASTELPDWNLGDLIEGIETALPPDAPAIIQGDRRIDWGELRVRTNNLAAELLRRGARPDDKIALYLTNGPAYIETVIASFKTRLVHVNVNFRYRDDELIYIMDNSDARFVVFDTEFADRVQAIAQRCDKVEGWIQVDEPGSATPTLPFATDYEEIVTSGKGLAVDVKRSGDDLLFIYTGGTTGMPKGVMWRQDDLWGALGAGSNAPANRGEKPASPKAHIEAIAASGPGPRQLPACPLMHGTGLLTTLTGLLSGGSIVLLEETTFQAQALFDTVERDRANSIIIVGDAFARPMLEALEANPKRWDLSSLKLIISSGVMWSREVKAGLLVHAPHLVLADMFGSSEAVGFGTSITTAKGESRTARFQIGPKCQVFTEDHRRVEPGSGERGFIARSGSIPAGYYKDLEKTAKTFPTIDGVRYSIPGDWCTVEADGTLTLLGRGSACINTAGEKVYPEEVEEALKTHADVVDALVVGVPDPKWGQAVTGVVELAKEATFDEAKLRTHVREKLAGYKTPKRIFATETMFRAPNGKADYKTATAFVTEQI